MSSSHGTLRLTRSNTDLTHVPALTNTSGSLTYPAGVSASFGKVLCMKLGIMFVECTAGLVGAADLLSMAVIKRYRITIIDQYPNKRTEK